MMEIQYPTTADQLPDYLREWAKSGAMTAGSSLPGVAPEDGWRHQGANAPTLPEGAKGYWAMTSSGIGPASNYGENSGMDQRDNAQWRFVGEKEPEGGQRQDLQQEEDKLPKYPDGNIYTDNDYWQGKSQAEAAGINMKPGVFSEYADISLMNPRQIENIFYPPAWQEEGVQKTIGPNGTNIGPKLQEEFGNAQAIKTNGQQDFPSLVRMLMQSGQIDSGQQQMLLGLTKPKKLDASFGGMGGGMGGQALLGAFK